MRITALLLAFALAACGIAGQLDARNDYQKSTAKYEQCLAAYAAEPQQCEALRLAMEADGRKYNETSPSLLDKIKPGTPPPDFADAQ